MVERGKGAFEGNRHPASVMTEDDEAARERAIEALLLDDAREVVRRVLRSSRRSVREEDFADYVATLTYNVIYDFLRSRYPQRTRLKNRIRYALQKDDRFALWDVNGETVAGLASWNGREPGTMAVEAAGISAIAAADPQRTAKAIGAVFAHTGAPVVLDYLVGLLGEMWNVTDVHVVAGNDVATSEARSPA